MAYYAKTVIDLAEQEVGYLEKASNANLDDKTANAGSGNYTKYARDLYNAGYYNGNKNGYAWCDVFVDWLFYKAFGKEVGQKLQCQTGDLGAGCKFSAQYYEKQGRLFKTPKIGDQIFFANNGEDPYHTGLVINVVSNKVYTIEGNTSSSSGVVANGGCVSKKCYSVNYGKIYGYGRPKYDTEDIDTEDVSNDPTITTSKSSYPLIRRGNTGEYVEKAQRYLNKWNYSLETDGIFGKKTEAAVIDFQTKKRLEVDGIVGPITWGALEKFEEAKADAGTKIEESASKSSYPLIRRGDIGEYVEKAQEYLNKWNYSLETDGIFGEKTEAAVIDFQTKKRLEVDGIVGPITWAALEKFEESKVDTGTKIEEVSGTAKVEFEVGDLVSVLSYAKYYNGSSIPDFVKKQNWYISEVSGDRVVIDRNEDGSNSIQSPINSKYLVLVRKKAALPFFVRVDIARLNIRTGPGTNYSLTGKYTGKGVFTIVEVSNGTGSNSGWGKLKSGAGWISLDYATKL